MLRLIQTFLLWRIYRNTRSQEPPKPPKPPKPPTPADELEKGYWKCGIFFVGMFIYGTLCYYGIIRIPDPEKDGWAAWFTLLISPILLLTYMGISFRMVNRRVDRKYKNLQIYEDWRNSLTAPEMEDETADLDEQPEVLPPPVPPFREGGNLR